ncbi:MAG TPA: DNA gyrase subunit A [Phycisphaerae bacterium]|nr:DNA gyrase subunit A [Phycisphaerae bacterium]
MAETEDQEDRPSEEPESRPQGAEGVELAGDGTPMAAVTLSNEQVRDLPVEEEMRESYLTYAMSTIMDRALPDARDGLKPSQRRVLVAMNDLNLGFRSKHRKCAKIAGDTSGNYHPHGEGVVYPTLVRMGQHWSMRYPLVNPQGNFGSIDGDPPAAMRYTEARMTAPAVEMLDDLNLGTVDMVGNYDDTRTEPTVLPGKFPNLLVNGSQGIAVGMATSIPPHNLREVCDGLVHLIDHPAATVDDLMRIVKGPDFPTGGMICGRSGIADGYRTGRGRAIVRARMHVEQARGGKDQIVVTEIPYQVLKTTIIERVAALVKSGRLSNVQDIQDHSDRTGMRIVIEVKKGVEPKVVVNQLYQYTPLQSTFSIINIALANRAPRTMSLLEMMQHFIEHRREVVRRRTMFLMRRARQRAHVLEGLVLAISDIDRIIELIKTSPDVPTARDRLMKAKLKLTEAATVRKLLPEAFVRKAGREVQYLTGVQADAILTMQLQRLTGLEIEKLARDYCKLVEEIEGYEAILRDETILMDVIREDIYEIKERYGDERRTDIIGDVQDFEVEDLIAEEDVVVTLTHEGYIKRMPLTTYRRQGRGGQGIIGSDAREGDFVEELFIASTHDYMLVFLDNGRMHWLKVYDIPSMARTSMGRAIVNVLDMRGAERICAVVAVREFDERFLVVATKHGQIKKTLLKAYSNPRKGGIAATGLNEGDVVIGVAITSGSDEIVLGTANGKSIRFKETDVRSMGRTAAGVRGVNLRDGDEVVDMAIMDPMASLLTVCENGHGKRTSFEEYRVQSRGGYGVINIRATKRNGKVVGMKSIREHDELMLITHNGMIVRTGINELRAIGRATQGVRLITLKPGDKLVAVARVVSEEQTQAEAAAKVAEEEPAEGEPLETEAAEPEAPAPPDAKAHAEPPGEQAAPPPDDEPAPADDDDDEEEDVTTL